MSKYDINSNPALVRRIIEKQKEDEKKYLEKHPDSLKPHFEQEMRELGHEFEVPSQLYQLMPKHKEAILPIVIRYYKAAKDNEKAYFTGFFFHKGLEEVVPMLLEDFYLSNTTPLLRSRIADTLWKIRSKKYIDDYLRIISNPEYKSDWLFIALLVSELKVEKAIPIFINMLDDEKRGGLAIRALGNYKREEFRPYFERFENDKDRNLREFAGAALKKLDIAKMKRQTADKEG